MHERVPPHLGWRLTRGSRSPAVMGGGRPDHAYLVGTQSRFRTPLPSALSPFSLPASLHPAQRARSAAAMLSPLCLCSSLRVSVFTRIRRQPHPELRLRFAEPLRMLNRVGNLRSGRRAWSEFGQSSGKANEKVYITPEL